MKILITGGAGYIGSITAAKLLLEGNEIIILDSLEKGYQTNLDKIKQMAGDFQFIKTDLRNKEQLKIDLQDKDFDAVIHFAAYIEIPRSVQQPEIFMENNYGGTENLLEILVEKRVKKFIFSSTAAVYGLPEIIPIPETAPLKPINPYGESKVKVEKLLMKMAKKGQMDSLRLRYFNPAGSYEGRLGEQHEPETHLIPLAIKAGKGERDKLLIYGDNYNTKDGTAIRDYIHVIDLVDAHITCLNYLMDRSAFPENGAKTDVFNIGTGAGYTVKEVFDTIKQVTGLDIPYEIVDRRAGDAERLVADPAKINAVLGWRAKYNLHDIVKSAWDFERQR